MSEPWHVKYSEFVNKANKVSANAPSDIKHEIFCYRLNQMKPHLKVLSKFQGSNKHIDILCTRCNEKSTLLANNLLYPTRDGCPHCGNKKGIERTIENNIKQRKSPEDFAREVAILCPNIRLIGTYINKMTKVEYECLLCNTTHNTSPSVILSGITGCPKCTNKSFRNTHEDFLSKLPTVRSYSVLTQYTTLRGRVSCRCNSCMFEWEATATHLINYRGCPQCAQKLYNTVYILLEPESGLYKIGMAKSFIRRLSNIQSCFPIFRIVQLNASTEVRALERTLHKIYSDKRTISTLAKSGNTEFFKLTEEDLVDIKRIMVDTLPKGTILTGKEEYQENENT